jgi:hypothetical protein
MAFSSIRSSLEPFSSIQEEFQALFFYSEAVSSLSLPFRGSFKPSSSIQKRFQATLFHSEVVSSPPLPFRSSLMPCPLVFTSNLLKLFSVPFRSNIMPSSSIWSSLKPSASVQKLSRAPFFHSRSKSCPYFPSGINFMPFSSIEEQFPL